MDVNRKLNVSFVGLFLLLTKGWKTLVFVFWWLAIMEVLASEWVRRKISNFQLLSVVQERLCLSSLMKFEGLGKRASIMN